MKVFCFENKLHPLISVIVQADDKQNAIELFECTVKDSTDFILKTVDEKLKLKIEQL